MAKARKTVAQARPILQIAADPWMTLAPGSTWGWRYVHCGNWDAPCEGCGKLWTFRRYGLGPFTCADCGHVTLNPQRQFHHFTGKRCGCPMGPQGLAFWSSADEVIMGGGRGSNKTETSLAFTIKGNPGADTNIPVNRSYVLHPQYRFLVLRKNVKDLEDWKSRAKRFYEPFGAVLTESPIIKFEFPSGAIGILDHMDGDDAFEKYMGQQYHRIIYEELTQCPSELLYARIKASCRSVISEMRPQVFGSANPGGPGHVWFTDRFISNSVKTSDSTWEYTDKETGQTRMFVHGTVDDNPYFMRDDAKYVRELDALKDIDEYEWRKWRLGDFSCVAGQYFPMFRPNGPMGAEKEKYPWANHVITSGSVPLMPWWHRWISCDWGVAHECAVYWGCQNPNGQVHVYREMVRRDALIADVGVSIALATLDDLRGLENHSMVMWLSHELFSKTGEGKNRAQQMGDAIGKILGPNAVAVLSAEEEREMDKDETLFWRNKKFQGRASIIIRHAKTDRIDGWEYLKELMRFVPLTKPVGTYDHNYAMKLAMDESTEKYLQYIRAFEAAAPETLPKLQIWDCCPRLKEAIPKAMRDPKNEEDVTKAHWEGADRMDSLRYLAMAHKFDSPRMPKEVYIAEKIRQNEGSGLTWTQRVQVAEKATSEYDKQYECEGFSICRGSSRSRFQPQEEFVN